MPEINTTLYMDTSEILSIKDRIKLTIERWEWQAKTGGKRNEWDKWKELNKIYNYCGWSDKGTHKGPRKGICFSCKFYDKKRKPMDRCFSGLFNKFKDEKDIEKRKEIAGEILDMIRKEYPND